MPLMERSVLQVLALAGSFVLTTAQTFPVYGQCGGSGFTSAGTCASGSYCQSENAYYYQCVPGTSTASSKSTTTSSKPASTTATTTKASATSSSIKTSSSTTTSKTATSTGSTQYLFVFGDSYSTTQFYIQGGYPSASDPIGQPGLPGSTTSGGLNWVGQVTSQLNSTLVLTYDWAYYGADTSDAVINTGVTTDMVAQVGEFEEYLAPPPAAAGAPWTGADALAAVWMGINDVGECFWESSVYAACPIAEVMETYFGLLGDLYDDGVRKFALLMVPPFYKAPVFSSYTTSGLASLVSNIETYNEALQSNFATFQAGHSGVSGLVFNTSGAFWAVLDDPIAYGAAADATCSNTDGTSCVWYDDYHPGQAIQRLVAEGLVDALSGTFDF